MGSGQVFWEALYGWIWFDYSKGHKHLQNVHVVLKLCNPMNSTSVTSLISGTLESLSDDDPNSFEPISMLSC